MTDIDTAPGMMKNLLSHTIHGSVLGTTWQSGLPSGGQPSAGMERGMEKDLGTRWEEKYSGGILPGGHS
jgi:hypothetical protein